MRSLLFVILFCLSFLFESNAQEIHFANISIKQAIDRANIEDKDIFVDTYAKWCGPCKKMDVVFKNREVANFFNKHFINVKIDMDEEHGQFVSRRYQVAFLPTLLILDKNGNRRYKVDRIMNSQELLSLAEFAVTKLSGEEIAQQERQVASVIEPPPATREVEQTVVKEVLEEIPVVKEKIVETPVDENAVKSISDELTKEVVVSTTQPKVSSEDITTTGKEKILYVLDADSENLPPEIMYEEAYFRMQLMDGSHWSAATRYLDTQDDWSTERNMKFLYDFLYDTESREFDFFVQHRDDFEKLQGKKSVDQTIEILANNKLYQGYPRPDLEESIYLFSLIDSVTGPQKAYHYFLQRLQENHDAESFIPLAKEYFSKFDSTNKSILFMYSEMIKDHGSKKEITEATDMLLLLGIEDRDYAYFKQLSYLWYNLSKKNKAIDSANQAIIQAKQEKLDYSEITALLEMIEEL